MVNLLELLPEYVLHWLVQKGTDRKLDAGERLSSEGEHNDSLFIILDGILAVSRDSVPGTKVERHGAGGIVGETAFFTDGQSSETLVTEEASRVLEIPRSVLATKLEHDTHFASDFYRALLQATAQKLRHVAARLHAAEAEAATDISKDPLALRAHEAITEFKRTVVALDKEAIKNGGLSEERQQEFLRQSMGLMHVCHEVLGSSSALADTLKQQIGARLQHEMLPYVLTTETADRFYSKPRGYAGDYLAIYNIYAEKAGGSGRLGRLVDRMFLNTPPSRAVRNRKGLLTREIVAAVRERLPASTRVLCLASGPATEVFDAYKQIEDRGRLQTTLMDIDLQALAFVDDLRSQQKLSGVMSLVNENLIALFLGRGKTRLEQQDLIYSLGLIDYLNDKLVGKLLSYAYDVLAPGGKILLGNMHPANPAKEFMDHVLEWQLIHRSEEDMNRLFQQSPFRSPCTRILFEEEGIDLFAECVKR